jgi:uncharacterized membrane protein
MRRTIGLRKKENVMDRQIVIVVPTETAAYQVLKALEALDEQGAIELYTATVVEKSATGSLTVEHDLRRRGPWATALGMSTGALIGLLGGPVGAAVGAVVGGSVALGGELAYSGFAGEFVHDVTAQLQPGGYAVCASVYEDWTVPVDTATAPFGVVVFRQATDDVVLAQMRAGWEAIKADQAHLEVEIQQAVGEQKARLEAKREELRTKEAAQRKKLHARATKLKETWDAEIASIEAKAEHAEADAKARHEQHVQKLSRFAAEQKKAFTDLFG